eukprot:15310055-Ditylum_brightwellii.AAC.1
MAGVTDTFYQSTPDCPSFGKVSTLLAALHNLCTGVKLFSICQNKEAERVADTYVDDTGNTYVNEEKQADETPESIRDSLWHIAVTWKQLLFGVRPAFMF